MNLAQGLKQYTKRLFFCVIICLFVQSCDFGKSKKIVDLTGVEVNLELVRFEQILFNFDGTDFGDHCSQLQVAHPDFFELFVSRILRLGAVNDSTRRYLAALEGFVQEESIKTIYSDVQDQFGDFNEQKKVLTEAFRHLKYYFPEAPVPPIYSFISEFGNGALASDSSLLGIGLDLFLGADYAAYEQYFPNYIREQLIEEQLLPNLMKVYFNQHFSTVSDHRGLVHDMIEQGKMLYFVEHMLPTLPDYQVMGYKKEQLEWCEASEYSIWQFFNEKDLLFETNAREKRRFIGAAPNTTGMPEEAPGDVGSWLGWQIVRSYAELNKVSLRELVYSPADLILKKSNYKP